MAFAATAVLLFIWLGYRLYRAAQPRRKVLRLDKEEIDLLGLIAETSEDLWNRLQAKAREKIILED